MRQSVLIVIAAVLIAAGHPAHEASAGGTKQRVRVESISPEDRERETILRGLIDEIDRIMEPPYDRKPGSEVRAVYQTVKEKMLKGEITWAIIDDNSTMMFSGFAPARKGGGGRIEVNHALVDSVRERPTLAMTMIMHEMRHARDYLTIGEKYKTYMKNPVENFMYEMDSVFIEAVFVRDFLSPRYKNLTPFEQYVLTSLEKDDLASVALVFMGEDMDLMYSLYGLGVDLDKGKPCSDYFGEFAKRGRDVTSRKIPTDEFEKFQTLIAIKTFATMAAPFVDGATARNERCKQSDHKAGVAEINGYIKKGNGITAEHKKFIEDYLKNVREKFFTAS